MVSINELLIATCHNLEEWDYTLPRYDTRVAYHRKLNISIGEVEKWNEGFTSFFCWTYMSRAVYLHRSDGTRIRVPVDKETSRTIKWLLDKLDSYTNMKHAERIVAMGSVESKCESTTAGLKTLRFAPRIGTIGSLIRACL